MSEIPRGDVSVLEHDSLSWSKKLTLVAPRLEEAPFAEFYDDIVMGSTTPSTGLIDPICNEPINLTTTSPPSPPTTPSHVNVFYESLANLRGYYPSFDPYCAYPEDVPRKILWSTSCDHIFYFSMAFGKFKRPLTFLTLSFMVFSYLHHFEKHVIRHDKNLRDLTDLSGLT